MYLNYFLLLYITIFLVGCSDSENKKKEYNVLKTELQKCANIAVLVDKEFPSYEDAPSDNEILNQQITEIRSYLNECNAIKGVLEKEYGSTAKVEEKLKEKLKEEANKIVQSARQAALKVTGMWVERHFIDDFGNQTEARYIENSSSIQGTFSNTATSDADLNVDILIQVYDGKPHIRFYLFEYAGNHPVKEVSSEFYTVLLQDSAGNSFTFDAVGESNYIAPQFDSFDLHNALLKGGKIQFVIKRKYFPTEYKFTINNADHYDNAFKMLLK